MKLTIDFETDEHGNHYVTLIGPDGDEVYQTPPYTDERSAIRDADRYAEGEGHTVARMR